MIRRKFVDYFTVKHGHKFVPSSSVNPKNDNTLSFVNAGMNQFKPLFLADQEKYYPSRVCNYQKCIRVGGKMCDLESIGRDFRHHTFFEMLGNWSFNDYGKQQACEWALDFIVNHLGLDQNMLSVTYFVDDTTEDCETKSIWHSLGIQPDRVIANNKGDNFWEMGSSGPCGQSTEIFYPVGNDLLELWNLVFIDRQKLPDSNKVVPLRNKFVDTGMGLERVLAVLEGVESNYDTDLFRTLFSIIESKSSVGPYTGSLTKELDINYRVLVDYCRMITIALADDIKPGRKGSAFDLRKIIKRSVDLSKETFKQETPRYLLFDLVDEIIYILEKAYPELPSKVKHIRRTLASESKRYIAHMESQ